MSYARRRLSLAQNLMLWLGSRRPSLVRPSLTVSVSMERNSAGGKHSGERVFPAGFAARSCVCPFGGTGRACSQLPSGSGSFARSPERRREHEPVLCRESVFSQKGSVCSRGRLLALTFSCWGFWLEAKRSNNNGDSSGLPPQHESRALLSRPR